MAITPLDIKQQEFKVAYLKGFDRDEVKSFLEMVASEFENLRRENLKLKEDLVDYKSKLADLKERETVIREAMVTTHKASEDIKVNAKKEAEIILSEAEISAERIINEAQSRLLAIIDDINDLKRQRTELMVSIKSIIDMHTGVLEAMKENDRAEINQKMELLRAAPKKVGEK